MDEVAWRDPIIVGSCTSLVCKAACCKFRHYTDSVTYTESYCEFLDQSTYKCTIYDTRPEGCRRYPQTDSFMTAPRHEGCGYHMVEADSVISHPGQAVD